MDGLGQLGIDIWSILYYLVNYGIILAVLGYYVYPRVYAILEKRESEISRSLDHAQELKNELAKELEKYHAEHKILLTESREQKKK
jgi:F0F1-type ATP synthase membrane subunit b/b'